MDENEPVTYRELSVGERLFRVPASGYYFNSNNCWARIDGSVARVGVSDFVQQNAGQVLSFDPPQIGLEYTIFEEICSLSAANTSIEVLSPVTGRLIAVNQELVEVPGLMNEDPYERGWVAELELDDDMEDIEMLWDCDDYFEISRAKISAGPLGCPCSRRGRFTRPGGK